MLVLAIWLFLIGYSVAITGKRNLGVSYSPQADGSIKPVDDKGNPAKTFSLLDVVTCAGASGTPAGASGTGTAPGRSFGSPGAFGITTPAKVSNPIARGPLGLPFPNLVPATTPADVLQEQGRSIRPFNQPSGPWDIVGHVGKLLTDAWHGLRSLL